MKVLDSLLIVIPAAIVILILLCLPVYYIRKRSENKKLYASLYLLLLIWAARFFVCLNGNLEQASELSGFEIFFDSLIHALQTFSMDEDYTVYTYAGKVMLEQAGLTHWAALYGGVVSVLNVCAPILGGALLLEILTGMFPLIRIKLRPFRDKIVFSELNEASICLAENIWNGQNYRTLMPHGKLSLPPLLIFTDAYTDYESEQSTELYDRARRLGAICIRSDLMTLALAHSRSVIYMLMDENVQGSLSTFSLLTDPKSVGRLYPARNSEKDTLTRIFVFVQEDYESELLKNMMREHDITSRVTVRIIRDYMNAAVNLMHDVPLFLPLMRQKPEEQKELHITIFGSGTIAAETLKAIYWCGQMTNVSLYVTVIADQVETLETRLRSDFPEMMECCDPDSPKLIVYPEAESSIRNAPYLAGLRFITMKDVQLTAEYPDEILRQTNYYVIALGKDDANLSLANRLRLAVAQRRLSGDSPANTVIVPAVFNSRVADAIRISEPDGDSCYLLPFATLDARFSFKNVFMANFFEAAKSSAELYGKSQQDALLKDEYSYWANLARSVHALYKTFSLGALKSVSLNETSFRKRFRIQLEKPLTAAQEDEIAWLEHRRWCAFLRTQGFSCPTPEQFEACYAATGKQKSIPLKLHACLVETELAPIRMPDSEEYDPAEYDGLDLLSLEMYRRKEKNEWKKEELAEEEYKHWDYKDHDATLTMLLEKSEKKKPHKKKMQSVQKAKAAVH